MGERPLPPDAKDADASTGNVVRGRLSGKVVVLCVCGSIAAYKAVLLLRLLLKEGAEVEVVLSDAARHFVGEATFAGLSGRAVQRSMFAPGAPGEIHVDLARRADLVLVVPATADTLSRIAQGRADELTTALVLSASCPVLAAPAMHPGMWSNPATQRNVATLAADRHVTLVGPVPGEVASGESGVGRMCEPEEILGAALAALVPKLLQGQHVVVSAGPTAEDLDPVRFISNRSSGKMGFAIAERAAAYGARVTLVAGPVALPTPPGVHRVDVRSAKAMRSALWQALHPDLSGAQALIMAAAVADFRPAEAHATKLKRQSQGLSLELLPNDDILAEFGQARQKKLPVLIGFALETSDEERTIEAARGKLDAKRVDMVVANHADESIGRDDIRALLVSPAGTTKLDSMPKEDAADRILSFVVERLREQGR